MKYFLNFLFIFLLTSCNFNKGYEVDIDSYNKKLYITVPPPKIGASGMGRIDWKVDLDAIEKEIFDEFRSSNHKGVYSVYLSTTVNDQYGSKRKKDMGLIGTISTAEIKKYHDYSYFKGKISSMIATGYLEKMKIISIP